MTELTENGEKDETRKCWKTVTVSTETAWVETIQVVSGRAKRPEERSPRLRV
jgi:hypothetical protein